MTIKTETLEFLKNNQSEQFTITQIAKSIKRNRIKVGIKIKELVEEGAICQIPFPAINGKATHYQYNVEEDSHHKNSAEIFDPSSWTAYNPGLSKQIVNLMIEGDNFLINLIQVTTGLSFIKCKEIYRAARRLIHQTDINTNV